MSTTLHIHDETAFGETTNTFLLDFLTERITVRELIRERVYEEVRQRNASAPEKPRRLVDWEEQYRRALDAFARNGFFVLVDDRQVESLDEAITIRPGTHVSFVRLVPLVGG